MCPRLIRGGGAARKYAAAAVCAFGPAALLWLLRRVAVLRAAWQLPRRVRLRAV